MTAVTLPIRGLIFDFDGLILDTETPSLQAWEELYQEHGGDFPFARWAMNIGTDGTVFDSHAELERQCGRVLDREALRDRRRRRTNDLIALAAVLPGVVEFLDAAADVGLRAAVASSSPRQWVDGHLDRLGLLERFLCTVCAEDVPRVKPDSALYLRAVDRLGMRPEEVIAFEDSPHGITAAQAAGIRCVAIPNPVTARMVTDHADHRFDSLNAMPLPALLRLISSSPVPVDDVTSPTRPGT